MVGFVTKSRRSGDAMAEMRQSRERGLNKPKLLSRGFKSGKQDYPSKFPSRLSSGNLEDS
jgi:hypothetical protein